jgi:hypothetical protein
MSALCFDLAASSSQRCLPVTARHPVRFTSAGSLRASSHGWGTEGQTKGQLGPFLHDRITHFDRQLMMWNLKVCDGIRMPEVDVCLEPAESVGLCAVDQSAIRFPQLSLVHCHPSRLRPHGSRLNFIGMTCWSGRHCPSTQRLGS